MAKNSKQSRSFEEQLGAITAQLEAVITKLNAQDEKLDNLEKLLAVSQAENNTLKEELRNRDAEVLQLKNRLNAVEQHNRSNSIRVFNLRIDGDSGDNDNVARQLYRAALLPILEGALSKGRLHTVPSCDELIDVAHILPTKADKINPIICRLNKRGMRTLLMQHKRDFAPRERSSSSSAATGSKRPPPFTFPIHEDMTRDAFQLMRAINAHEDVLACWSSGGQLRFRLKGEEDSNRVHRVFSVYEPVISIVANAKQ